MFARPHTYPCILICYMPAGFYMLCSMMTKKNYLSTAPCGNKIINQSLTPYYQISESISSFIENSLEHAAKQESKTGRNQAWLFLLSAHQRDMRSDAVQDPIFYQPFDLSNIEFESVPVEQGPCPEFQASI
jgi:hypothetical protein